MSQREKQPAEKKTEPPPCVIYPKGGKGNARSKPEKGKGMVLRPEIARIGSRLRKGKVLAPLTSAVLDGIHAQKNRKRLLNNCSKRMHTHWNNKQVKEDGGRGLGRMSHPGPT